jgi:hypothetical protein
MVRMISKKTGVPLYVIRLVLKAALDAYILYQSRPEKEAKEVLEKKYGLVGKGRAPSEGTERA